ncbi:CLUMA_CG021188, isoform A [Clunio marinus]|uniref:CLUMA_CG021188, isoform A n=1 Tax=Clunio marinus TaxID=568069 RepID=A0A1J1J8C5_9DIPT|nr:CLUMA_CG021188, isoform A [Clunio marinus]
MKREREVEKSGENFTVFCFFTFDPERCCKAIKSHRIETSGIKEIEMMGVTLNGTYTPPSLKIALIL